MTLAEQQRRFCAWLRNPDEDLADLLGPGLAVYQNNYRVALVEALRATHPRAAQWLGDRFEALAARHVDAHPPAHWTIDAYGAAFPAWARQDDPIAGDLAAIDRAVGEAFVAADAVPATPGDLDGIDWDRAVIRPVPSLIVLPVASNADALWLAMASGAAWPAPRAEAATLLVWRQGFETVLRRAGDDELAMLAASSNGDSFATICAQWAAGGDEADAVTRAGTVLGRWLNEALIAGF
jgi:hypothetical protein